MCACLSGPSKSKARAVRLCVVDCCTFAWGVLEGFACWPVFSSALSFGRRVLTARSIARTQTNSRRRLLRRARFREVLESRATDGQRGRLQTGWGRGRRRRRRRRWFKAAKRFVKKATRKVVKVAKKVHKHAKKAVKTVARHVKKSFHTLVNVGRIARCAASFKRCRRGFCPDRVCLPRNCKRIPGGKGYMIPRSWNRVRTGDSRLRWGLGAHMEICVVRAWSCDEAGHRLWSG